MASRRAIHPFFKLRIAYQPFLSTSKTQYLTSLLAANLPHYDWLHVGNTSLHLPSDADIVLLSRGGKPFAPRAEPLTAETIRDQPLRTRDWEDSANEYKELVKTWRPYGRRLESLIKILRTRFPKHVIFSQNFEEYLKGVPKSEIPGEDRSQLRKIWTRYIKLKRATEPLKTFLEKTRALEKAHAHKYFEPAALRAREYVIEDLRDRLDLLRFELEKRFMGMANVLIRDLSDPKPARPWVLVPEDPISAWGTEAFPAQIQRLLLFAEKRFLGDLIKEREIESGERRFKKAAAVLSEVIAETPLEAVFLYSDGSEDECKELEEKYGAEALERAVSFIQELEEEFGLEEVIDYINETRGDEIDEEGEIIDDDAEDASPSGPLTGDEHELLLPVSVTDTGKNFKIPYTTEDKAIYSMSDVELVKGGAWRVAD